MPVKSQKQWRWLAINRPDLLDDWQKESPVDFDKLPRRKRSKKRASLTSHRTKKRGTRGREARR